MSDAGVSDLGGLFQTEDGEDRMPTYDEVRYILISKGVPERAANDFAAGDAWKGVALSNPGGFGDYLEGLVQPLIQSDRERQQAENQAGAGTRSPNPAAQVPTPAPAAPASSGGVMGSVPTPTSTPVNIDQEIRDQFPAFAWLMDDPQIGQLLRDSVTEGWPPEKLQARLYGTDWWKTHSEPLRKWKTLDKADPAEAKRQRDVMDSTLWDAAFRMTGGKPDRNVIRYLSETALQFGLSEGQITDLLVSTLTPEKSQTGQAGQILNQLRQIRDDYMVSNTGDVMRSWVRRILSGEATVDDFKVDAAKYARSAFGHNPDVEDALNRGQTMREYLGPYAAMAAEDLGVTENAIDFRDPKWSRALGTVDPKTGKRIGTSLHEWQTYLRSTDDFRRGRKAQQIQADVALFIARETGLMA